MLVTANRQIDASTGTIQLQALFPNADGTLRAGQYGRVRIQREGEGKGVLAVPEKALIQVQGQYSLAVVGPDNKVAVKRVELGATAKGLRIVKTGINEGDKIVVDGIQKATDGATVAPTPAPPTSS